MMNETKILKAISEPTRLRVMHLLLKTKKELCGCELVDSLEIPQYNLTKHLDILINAGLIQSRKEGRWVNYSVCNFQPGFEDSLCRSILKLDDIIYKEDLKRFKKRLKLRKDGKCYLGIQNKKFI